MLEVIGEKRGLLASVPNKAAVSSASAKLQPPAQPPDKAPAQAPPAVLADSCIKPSKPTQYALAAAAEKSRGEAGELDATRLYLNDIGAAPLLTAEQEVSLSRRAQRGCEQARKQMIESNLRLVVKIARRYLHRKLPLLDLIEEGNLGLMHAVDKFDPEMGYRFSTYATWWIRQSIERGVMNQSATVRLPVHVIKALNALLRIERELEQSLGRKPSCAELAQAVDKPVMEVRKTLLLRSVDASSLDEPPSIDGDGSVIELSNSPDQTGPAENLQGKTVAMAIQRWLGELSEKQQAVLVRRFGLNGHEHCTLERVGEQIGLTRERVRQIQLEGLTKIRRMINRDGLSAETLLD